MLHLFGDESCFGTAVTYAVVVVPADRQPAIEDAFGYVKDCFGTARTARFHCREVFSGQQRKKSSWAHLSQANLFELMTMTGNYLRLNGARFRVGLIDTRKVGERFSAWGEVKAYPAGPKQLVAFAHVMALAGIEKYPGGSELKLWKDPDTTMIEWGNNRRQAGGMPVFMDGGQKIVSEPIVGEKPSLIDVADILAYAASHAFSATELPNRASFGQAFDAFSPELARMNFHPQAFEGSADDQEAVTEWLTKGLHPLPRP